MTVFTGDPIRDALLVRIVALRDLALVEAYRYPGGGLGFLEQAQELERRLRL